MDLHAAVRQLPLSVIGIIRNDSLEGLKYSGAVGMKEEYNVLQTPVGVLSFRIVRWYPGLVECLFRIALPGKFVRKERRVELKGEAYFQVSRDSLRPFCKLPRQNIRVLGTSFNVRSYSANQEYTTLESGRVSIHCLGARLSFKTWRTIAFVGYICCYCSCTFGKLYRMEKSMLGLRQLCVERKFSRIWNDGNVQIELEDESIGLRHFTGNFRRYDNIDTVLEMIGLVAHVKYEVKGRDRVFMEVILSVQ